MDDAAYPLCRRGARHLRSQGLVEKKPESHPARTKRQAIELAKRETRDLKQR